MFSNYTTVSEVKRAYKNFAFKLHPDKGGSQEAFVEMQRLYFIKLEGLDGQTSKGFDGKEHTYKYNANIEKEVAAKISELLKLKLSGIDIELVGTWLWISGNTKPFREAFKTLKLKWHSKRLMWFFHAKTGYKRRVSNMTMDQIRYAYGSQTFVTDENRQIA